MTTLCLDTVGESALQSPRALLGALKGIVNALPIKRDWLDPEIERFARAVIADTEARK